MGSSHSVQTTLSHGLKPFSHPGYAGTFSSVTTTATTSSSVLGDAGSELNVLMRHLGVSWVVFDREFDLIVYTFLCRVLQSPCEDDVAAPQMSGAASVSLPAPELHPNVVRTLDAVPDTAPGSTEASVPTVSPTLRAGVLGLEAVGVRRVIDVLAYIAADCKSREDRVLAAAAQGECDPTPTTARPPLGFLSGAAPAVTNRPPHVLFSGSTNEGSTTWSAFSFGSRYVSQNTSSSQSMNFPPGAIQQLLQQTTTSARPTRQDTTPSPTPSRGPVAVLPLGLLPEHRYNAGLLLAMQAAPRVSLSPPLPHHPTTPATAPRSGPKPRLDVVTAACLAPQHPAMPPSHRYPRRVTSGVGESQLGESAGAPLSALFHDMTDDRGASLRGMTSADAMELLCTTFAHLHLTDEDVVSFVVLLLDTVCEVQGWAMAATHRLAGAARRGRTRRAESEDSALAPTRGVRALPGSCAPSTCSCRVHITPCLERYLLPCYQHYVRVLTFVSGCERAVPLLLRHPYGRGGSLHAHPSPCTPAHSATTPGNGCSSTTTGATTATESCLSPPGLSQAPQDRRRGSDHPSGSLVPPPRSGRTTSQSSRCGVRTRTDGGSAATQPTSLTVGDGATTLELVSSVLDESEVNSTPSMSLLSNPLGPSSVRMQCSQAHQYFREQCPMLADYAASVATSSTPSTSSTLSSSTTRAQSGRLSSGTYGSQSNGTAARYRSEMLSMKSDYVLHYAEVLDESTLAPGPTPTVMNGYGDAFACIGSDTLWPLASRLLMLRGQYLYLYDAVATTVSALGGQFSALGSNSAAGAKTGSGSSLMREMNSPIALFSVSGAMESNFGLVGEADETEVVHMGPSRVVPAHRVSAEDGVEGLSGNVASRRAALFRGSAGVEVHVYRLEHRQHGIVLLTFPVSMTAARDAGTTQGGGVNTAWSQYAATSARGGVRTSDEAATGRSRQSAPRHGPDDVGGDLLSSPRMSEFAAVGVNEVIALTVYPLRVCYKGALHHFFFQSASARAEWRHRLTVLATCARSRAHLSQLARAPQNVEAFIRRRISFPVVPDAFDYLDVLGVGTFGRVLLVRHKLTGRLFALKVIRKTGFHGIRNVVEVRRERRILDLLDCPYIMRIHASFQTDSRVYLLLDYLPGGELLMHTQRAPQHHFNEECSRFFIAELAIAVEHLRRHGILHRDIKGDNLVLDEGGHVVLSDFGFAKKITVPLTDEAAAAAVTEPNRVVYLQGPHGGRVAQKVVPQHTSCGTLAYIAPEILHSGRKARGYGLEVDWWSTGVVLFTILTGYFPFLKAHHHDTSNAIVNSPLQFPPRSNISDAAQSLLLCLMEKDPARRISSFEQLKQHYFFHDFDWEACEQRRMRPPVLLHKDTYRKAISISAATERLRGRVVAMLWPDQRDNAATVASASAPLNRRYTEEFNEELLELQLVQLAYRPGTTPEPTSYENDVFGELFDRQEECGSDRGQDDDVNTDQDANPSYIPSTTLLPPRLPASPGLHAAMASRGVGPFAHSDAASLSGYSCNNYGIGNASLNTAHEPCGGSQQFGSTNNGLADLADGLEPVTDDFNEAAYTSMSKIRHACAAEASLADVSLYRPVCDP